MRRGFSFRLGMLAAFSGTLLVGAVALAADTPLLAAADPHALVAGKPGGAVVAKPARPRIEVMFVLDTTGSMSGLIEGAKRKIWSIADELASAQPEPELRVGLIAYRDRGDAYITQRFDLTEDLDALYQKLQALQADGGGDGPESVNQALHEAVASTHWTAGPSVYRAVFLVGDAPPHMDYDNDVPYTQTMRSAAASGIVINTVQCGSENETRRVWSQIAKHAQGMYAAIEQSGGMMAIAAPMDADIARLNAELSDTVVPYGDAGQKERVAAKASLARGASAEAGAARISYLSKKGGDVVTGRGDLVDDVRRGRVKLASVPASELPQELRGRPQNEQAEELGKRAAAREKIKGQLDKLVQQRNEYVKAEEKKLRASGGGDGFDAKVKTAVKAQAAAAAGVTYKD